MDEYPQQPELKPGRYRHYKGHDYEVIDLACHSETGEWLVLYRRLYDRDGPALMLRPYDMFVETVEVDGKQIPRFAYVGKV